MGIMKCNSFYNNCFFFLNFCYSIVIENISVPSTNFGPTNKKSANKRPDSIIFSIPFL